MAFSPDGKTIAAGYSGQRRGGVVLWDAAARKRLVDAPLDVKEGVAGAWPSAPTARPSRPVHRPRRHRPAAAWCCGTWISNPGRRIAGRIANRNFTRDEWRQYFPDQPYHATFPDLPVPAEAPRH